MHSWYGKGIAGSEGVGAGPGGVVTSQNLQPYRHMALLSKFELAPSQLDTQELYRSATGREQKWVGFSICPPLIPAQPLTQ